MEIFKLIKLELRLNLNFHIHEISFFNINNKIRHIMHYKSIKNINSMQIISFHIKFLASGIFAAQDRVKGNSQYSYYMRGEGGNINVWKRGLESVNTTLNIEVGQAWTPLLFTSTNFTSPVHATLWMRAAVIVINKY